MDAGELELFRSALRQATTNHTGKALEDALDELGWRDALAADRQAAVSTLFELQGEANATSSALDVVIAGTPAVLPPLGSCDQPAVRGLGTYAYANSAPDGVTLRPVDGIDPSLGLVEVTGRLPFADASSWPETIAAGQLALAHELIGASRAMLELARTHALERVQFDRPIASFQAVRHRLAGSLVAIEAADSAAGAAWKMETPLSAMAAKAVAGRSARVVAKHCQ
ncbi:MAG: acyl-CoA dehydrogenase, partial [Acidimicrobiia bacterium]|nr:acyl-CoA dehydrogenase [Acidimicrobiia bacterium]